MQKNDNFTVTDQRRNPYTVVENGIIDSMSFKKPIDKLLYITVCRFSHMQQIFPSMGTLMLMCGISSVNTLKEALKRLKDMQIMDYKDRGLKDNGEHNTHEYILLEVPESILENSVFKTDKVQEKKAVIKRARKEKAQKTNHNKHKKKDESPTDQGSKKGTSNFDGGASNFDGGISNFDGGLSNFEHKNKESINTEVSNQESTNKEYLSIQEQIPKLNIPTVIVEMLKTQIDRLILLKIKLIEIELVFKDYEMKLGHDEFKSVLYDVLQAEKIEKSFKKYLATSLDNMLKNKIQKADGIEQPQQVKSDYDQSSYQTDYSQYNFRQKSDEDKAYDQLNAMYEADPFKYDMHIVDWAAKKEIELQLPEGSTYSTILNAMNRKISVV